MVAVLGGTSSVRPSPAPWRLSKGPRCARAQVLTRTAPRRRGRLTLGGRERSEGPLERSGRTCGTSSALEVPLRHAGQSVASLGPRLGIAQTPGPGCAGDSPGARLAALRLWDWIPSTLRACLHAWVSLLGMPFGLTTPGGQPVAVCLCRVPLMLGRFVVLMSAPSTNLAVVSRQDTVKCPGPRSRGISHFVGASLTSIPRKPLTRRVGGPLQAERAALAPASLGTLRNLDTRPDVCAGQGPFSDGHN